MKKKQKPKYNLKWIAPGFIIFLIGLQLCSYFVNSPKFKVQNAKITVADVFDIDIVKGTVYTDYVYLVDSKIYKSSTGEDGGKFRDWNSPEIRKYPVIYNAENPKLNFLLTENRLPDTLVIGTELENIYFDNEGIKKRMLTQTIQKAYTETKYIEKYFEIKHQLIKTSGNIAEHP